MTLGALLCCLSPAREASADPPPEGVRITRAQYNGRGCPDGSAVVDLVGGNTAFIITYDAFNAQAGPEVSPSEARSRCNLQLHFDYPDGWSFKAESAVYRGNAILGDRVKGRVEARYNFPGNPSAVSDVEMVGPFLQDFELLKVFDSERWSPCRRRGTLPMLVTASVEVDNRNNPSTTGLVTVEQSDGSFKMRFNLDWKRCF